MIAALYSCFRLLPLLLPFRQLFREPSGSFRDAGFEHVGYGCWLQEAHVDFILLVTYRSYAVALNPPEPNPQWTAPLTRRLPSTTPPQPLLPKSKLRPKGLKGTNAK